MDFHEERAVEGAAAADGDGVPGVNPQVAQAALHAVPGSDGDDACRVSGSELIERHETLMITILILKANRLGGFSSPGILDLTDD